MIGRYGELGQSDESDLGRENNLGEYRAQAQTQGCGSQNATHDTLIECRFNAVTASMTLAQH